MPPLLHHLQPLVSRQENITMHTLLQEDLISQHSNTNKEAMRCKAWYTTSNSIRGIVHNNIPDRSINHILILPTVLYRILLWVSLINTDMDNKDIKSEDTNSMERINSMS
jgi:hypothetical protein